jgi:hypothetical protein
VQRSAVSHARLMRESTDRVQSALHGDNYQEYLIANRIMESPAVWQQWESEHAGLMRQVAGSGVARAQAANLKQTAFRLIHRKALFEYLRDNEVRGDVRKQIFTTFHPTYGYSHAVVAEHGMYLRKACSFLCTNHVGTEVVGDAAFDGPMQEYERLYTEYFSLYCGSSFAENDEELEAQQTLLPLLKAELEAFRAGIIDPAARMARQRRDAELRRPTGDTQRMPALSLPAKTSR